MHSLLAGSTCKERCGDGIDIKGTYACDDGNNLSKDGCSDICTVEAGFTCTAATKTKPSVCTEKCDGTWSGFLPCDSGAGVTANCCSNCNIMPACNC
jgi:cysteine-rich repeat protein